MKYSERLTPLQLTSSYGVATPANWKDGGECIIVNSISDEEAIKDFQGFH